MSLSLRLLSSVAALTVIFSVGCGRQSELENSETLALSGERTVCKGNDVRIRVDGDSALVPSKYTVNSGERVTLLGAKRSEIIDNASVNFVSVRLGRLGVDGWISSQYLCTGSGEAPASASAWVQKMISHVKNIAGSSQGLCWTYVQRAFNVSRGASESLVSLPGNSSDNISRLQGKGFCRSKDKRIANAPIGSILIYRPGHCGAHASAGHGEIKVSSNQLCSDFCWTHSGSNSFKAGYSCTSASEVMYPCK